MCCPLRCQLIVTFGAACICMDGVDQSYNAVVCVCRSGKEHGVDSDDDDLCPAEKCGRGTWRRRSLVSIGRTFHAWLLWLRLWLWLVIIGYHWSLGFSDRDYYDVVLTVIIMMMNKRSVPHLQHHHYHHQEHLRIVMNSKDDQDDKTHGEQEGRACGELQAVLQREPHLLPRSQNWCGDDHFIYFHSWS